LGGVRLVTAYTVPLRQHRLCRDRVRRVIRRAWVALRQVEAGEVVPWSQRTSTPAVAVVRGVWSATGTVATVGPP
jgi:hypothetical protein